MKIAIIGKGLSGLAAAFYLSSKGHKLDVFYDDPGASMAASGLIHPFVGDTGEKSFRGDEAFEASIALFKQLNGDFYTPMPFIRYLLSEKMKEGFEKQSKEDVEFLDDTHVLIKKSARIDVPLYLETFEAYLKNKGVTFTCKKIASVDELQTYDRVIVAAGYGIKDLQQKVKLKYLKGQSLIFTNLHVHEKPLIAKGYLVPFGNKVIIGSTYEKIFTSSSPDIYTAYKWLEAPIKDYFKPYDEVTPMAILSGVRVAHPNFAPPQILIQEDKTVFLTGFGSRGLLYHALYGKLLAEHIDKLASLPEAITITLF